VRASVRPGVVRDPGICGSSLYGNRELHAALSSVDVKKAWAQIIEAAGITGLRMHDLRHSYASMLVNSGLSLPVIGALLGHSQVSTTHRYAHLADDPLRVATERVAKQVADARPPRGRVFKFPCA
jgi:site-specific recombinase XerD